MKRLEAKRRRSAWILLAVFLPVLLLSITHTHGAIDSQAAECQQCLQHVHHTHFGATDHCIDNCVLCQMISMAFVPAAALVLTVLSTFLSKNESAATVSPCAGIHLLYSGRSPPRLAF